MIDLSGLRRLKAKRGRRSPVRPARWMVLIRVAAGLGAAALLCGAVWAILTMPALSVAELQVVGTARLGAAEVDRRLAALHGQPMLLVSLSELRRAVEEIPTVQQAIVARRLPDCIRIEIVERQPVARVDFYGTAQLVDSSGALFAPGQSQLGDEQLPLLINPLTPYGEPQLLPADRRALIALRELHRVAGSIPAGTFVDLRPSDRLILQPGPDTPVLWLDRQNPGSNLASYFLYQNRLAELGPIGPVDLRFPQRLTIQPAPQTSEQPLAPPADDGAVVR